MYKIIGADGKEYRPISADQIRQWMAEGRANGNTRIRPEGAADWYLLAQLPEFSASIPRSAPVASVASAPGDVMRVTNSLALWSMVIGIMSVVLVCCVQAVLGPIAIAMGIAALSQIRSDPTQGGSGFAITGIIFGVVALLIFVLLIVLAVHNPETMQQWQRIHDQMSQPQ